MAYSPESFELNINPDGSGHLEAALVLTMAKEGQDQNGGCLSSCRITWDTSGFIGEVTGEPVDVEPEWKKVCGGLYVVTPGLVNTHAHLELSVGEIIPPTEPGKMGDWLQSVVAYLKGLDHSPEARKARCVQGAGEMLAAGTTCINDIGRDWTGLTVLQELGMAGRASLEIIAPHHNPSHPDSASYVTWLQDTIAQGEALCGAEKSGIPPSRQTIGLSPHSPYNVSVPLWTWLRATYPHLPVHTHVAESCDEDQWVQGKPSAIDTLHEKAFGKAYGPQIVESSMVRYVQRHGLLRSGDVIAHGVFATEAEQTALMEAGVGIAHCPRSNILLHGKTALPRHKVGDETLYSVGTDSHISTPDLDLRTDGRLGQEYHGWSAQDTLAVMTRHGATVLGMGDRLGQLKPGYWADMVVWFVPASVVAQFPNSPAHWILDPASSVDRVLCAGTLAYEPMASLPGC